MEIEAKDIIDLVDAALSADYTRVRRVVGRIAEELEKQDREAARTLRTLIRRKGVPLRASGYAETLPVDSKSRLPLIEEQPWPTTPIFLNEESKLVFDEFISDAKHADALSAKGLSSRLSLMISGPPGTGKTLLAGHIASQLSKPLYNLRLDSVISSLLGDTAKNVRNLFDYVPTRDGVLFLDEIDAVAKLRDDRHELGELKRVVNTVIQSLDALDDRAVVVAATNHVHMLDPAIFRRFPYRVDLGLPDAAVREELWRNFLFEGDPASPMSGLLASISDQLSGASIRDLALAARRHSVLLGRPIDPSSVAWAIVQTKEGRMVLPDRKGLTTEQKRALATQLVRNDLASAADVARLLRISRQAVSVYLKDA